MKRWLSVLLVGIMLCCSGCGASTESVSPEDYMLTMPYQENFKILQLTDIHLANKDNREAQYAFLDLTIRDADADLIVLSGDTFTFADRRTVREVINFLEQYDTPWTMVFGNHDEQCYFSVDWLTKQLNEHGGNCYFRDVKDDVFGYCNFAINLTDEDGIAYQVILMDSNRYHYGDYIGYDYIKQNQIDWYRSLVNRTGELNGGEPVPSILFFHIPVPEFADAWEAAQAGDPDVEFLYGTQGEGNSAPKYNSGFFDAVLEGNSTKAICVGHDHLNNWCIRYKGVYLSYGVDSTDRIYFDEDLLGGQVVTLQKDGSVSFSPICHTYEEVNK